MQTTATIEQLHKAMKEVNKKFAGNVIFKDLAQKTKNRVLFTLTVKDSKGPGGRLDHSGRRIKAACWHVHGHFFNALWDQDPTVLVISGRSRMQSKADNWQDFNIGSQALPLYFSEACECEQ